MNIQLIDRVVLILNTFTPRNYEMTLTQIKNETGLSKTTTHRLVNAMVASNLLAYDPHAQKYRLGIFLLHMGNIVKNNLSLTKIAEPYMLALRDQVDENVMLKVVDGEYAVSISYVETSKYYRPRSGVGRRDSLCIGASSKLLLAFFEENEIQEVLEKSSKNEELKVDFDVLTEQLREIRKNQYAISFGERVQDGVGVSVPVFDFNQKVIASLTIVGDSLRMTEEKIQQILAIVIETGKKISIELGYNQELGVVQGKHPVELV